VLDEKLRRIEAQIASPFAQHADELTTHLAKMSFRLAVPLLARVLHLPLATPSKKQTAIPRQARHGGFK